MFDIAWSELLIVAIVALVVVGPKDLPKLMRTVGRWMAKVREMADQFRKSFDEMSRQSELEELKAEINALRAERPLADSGRPAVTERAIAPPDDAEKDRAPPPPGGSEPPAP